MISSNYENCALNTSRALAFAFSTIFAALTYFVNNFGELSGMAAIVLRLQVRTVCEERAGRAASAERS